MGAIVYDLEIEKAIPSRKEPVVPGIAYCEGWHDHKGMGISTLCAYDYEQDRIRVFCKDNVREFAALVEAATCVVGFNNISFDDRVVLASWGVQVPAHKTFDLLQEVWSAHGLGPDFNFRTHGGFSLDACARANGLRPKSGHGELAPIDWQRGNFGAVIDYCINDVLITRQLFDILRFEGQLTCPKTARKLQMRQPPQLAPIPDVTEGDTPSAQPA